MKRVTQVLATTSEISLKGGNRMWFERTLTENVEAAVAGLPVAAVSRPSWRVLITFTEPVSFSDVVRRLVTVFGLGAIVPVALSAPSLDDIESGLPALVAALSPASFAVRCLRSDKRYPMTSPEIERRIGRTVQDLTGWKVDLKSPELTIHLLVEDRALYLWTQRVEGPGGLPVGVGGRATCMISGGIDSPVAAWMMMKRGMRLDFVHFHSAPRTDPASIEKVRELVRVLVRYQGPAALATVPLLPIQEEIAARCPSAVRLLLYRRFMLRLAGALAQRWRSQALITGESLGQVASQTIENLRAIEAASGLPVLRPLIGLDKAQIVELGRRIGTYEISIQPHMDCCSFLMPERPATRSTPKQLADAERALDTEALTAAALDTTDVSRIQTAAPWSEMPVPTEVSV